MSDTPANQPPRSTLEHRPTRASSDAVAEARDGRRCSRAARQPDRADWTSSTPDTFIPESVDQLLAHSRRYPLLTPAQEIDLAKRIERGDLHAKELLVNSNLRLVASNARRYQNQGLPLGDLVQEGMLGLIRASEKFDWRKGFRFSTYATLWIRQAIQRGLENSGRTIRLPVHVAQRSRKVGRVERELSVRLGREPTLEELAQETGLPIEQVEEVRHQRAALVSLDQQIGEDGDTALGDLLPSDAEAPEETAWEQRARADRPRGDLAAARNRAHGPDAALRHRPRGAPDADRDRQAPRLLRRARLAARAARAEEARRVAGAGGAARGRVEPPARFRRPAGTGRSDEAVMAAQQSALANLGQAATLDGMRVNVGEAKTNLSRLLARVEAGEEIEIARNSVPVARLVKIEPEMRPGEKFLAGAGAMAGQIWISDDFEFSEDELNEMDEDDELL